MKKFLKNPIKYKIVGIVICFCCPFIVAQNFLSLFFYVPNEENDQLSAMVRKSILLNRTSHILINTLCTTIYDTYRVISQHHCRRRLWRHHFALNLIVHQHHLQFTNTKRQTEYWGLAKGVKIRMNSFNTLLFNLKAIDIGL